MKFIEYDDRKGSYISFIQDVLMSSMMAAHTRYGCIGVNKIAFDFDVDINCLHIKFNFINKDMSTRKIAIHICFKDVSNLRNGDSCVSLKDAGLSYPCDEYIALPKDLVEGLCPDIHDVIMEIVKTSIKLEFLRDVTGQEREDVFTQFKESLLAGRTFDASELCSELKISISSDDKDVIVKYGLSSGAEISKTVSKLEFENMSADEIEELIIDVVQSGQITERIREELDKMD